LDPPEACPVVAVCKEGIVVGYFLASKSDPTLHKAIIKDGPHPSGIVPRANAPTIDAEMTRMHQAMAAAFSR
jgi:hypothetical protein